jgi:meso-butanediol dehydrogenase / (S,S)-butanediol dehydrogenase / diacetyl reductase
VYAAVDHAETELGGSDIVNNAGIALIQPIAESRAEDVDKVVKVNVQDVLWGIQAAAKKFRESQAERQDHQRGIHRRPRSFPLLGIYSASKFAVRALTKTAAREFAADGITVDAYCLGVVGTDMRVEFDRRMTEITGAEIGASFKKFVGGIALGRAQTRGTFAAFVSFWRDRIRTT